MPQDAAPLFDGLLRVGAFLGELRDLRDQRRALRSVAHASLGVAEHRGKPGRLAARGAPLAEERQHAGMGRLELAGLLEPWLGRVRARAHPVVHHRDLQRRAELLLLAPEGARRELALVERNEVLPHLARGEVVREKGRGLRLPGRDVEDALVGRRRPVGRLQLGLERPRQPQPARDFLVLGRGLAGEALERLRHLVPAPPFAKDTLEQHLRAPALRVDGERLAQQADDALEGPFADALPAVAVDNLGRADEQRATEAGIAAVRLLHVAIEEIAPLCALGGGTFERLRGVLVVGRQNEEGFVGRTSPRVVEELLVENPRTLGEQGPFAVGAAGNDELYFQEPADRLVLAAHLVGAARGLEERGKVVLDHAIGALDFLPQSRPGLLVVWVILQQAKGALDALRAHPSPCRGDLESPGSSAGWPAGAPLCADMWEVPSFEAIPMAAKAR